MNANKNTAWLHQFEDKRKRALALQKQKAYAGPGGPKNSRSEPKNKVREILWLKSYFGWKNYEKVRKTSGSNCFRQKWLELALDQHLAEICMENNDISFNLNHFRWIKTKIELKIQNSKYRTGQNRVVTMHGGTKKNIVTLILDWFLILDSQRLRFFPLYTYLWRSQQHAASPSYFRNQTTCAFQILLANNNTIYNWTSILRQLTF